LPLAVAGSLTATRLSVQQVAGISSAHRSFSSNVVDSAQVTSLHGQLLSATGRFSDFVPGPQFVTSTWEDSTAGLSLDSAWRRALVNLTASVLVQNDRDAKTAVGLFAYNVSIVDIDGLVQRSMPLLLRIMAPGVQLAPALLQGQVAPDATNSTMQLFATLTAMNGDTSVLIQIPAAASCWLSLAESDLIQPVSHHVTPTFGRLHTALINGGLYHSGNSLHISTVRGDSMALQVRFQVDLQRLTQGLHSTTVTVVVGDIALTTLSLPVSVLVASVIPCPQRVQLSPIMPKLSQGDEVRDTSAFVLRNIAAVAPHRIVGVAVLLGAESGATANNICGGSTALNTSHSFAAQFEALRAQQPTDGSAWLRLGGQGSMMGPSSSFVLPAQVFISRASTPRAGNYSASVAVLVQNVLNGAYEIARLQVHATLLQGPVAWASSDVLLQQPIIAAQHLPLGLIDSRNRATLPLLQLPTASGLLLSGRLLFATAVLRDALGVEHSAGGNVITAALQAQPSVVNLTQRLLQGVAPIRLDVTVRPLTENEATAAAAAPGLTQEQRVGLLAAVAPLGVLIDPVQLLDIVPVGWSLSFSLAASQVSSGAQVQQRQRAEGGPLSLPSVSIAPAQCDQGKAAYGLGCACAPGYAANTVQPPSAISSESLSCLPCAAGSANGFTTLGSPIGVCLVCVFGTFSLSGAAACRPCPVGAVCISGHRLTLNGYGYDEALPSSMVGRYQDSNLSAATDTLASGNIMLCPFPGACLADSSQQQERNANPAATPSKCLTGHTGPLCARSTLRVLCSWIRALSPGRRCQCGVCRM
jgi:hypothetical protein